MRLVRKHFRKGFQVFHLFCTWQRPPVEIGTCRQQQIALRAAGRVQQNNAIYTPDKNKWIVHSPLSKLVYEGTKSSN